MLEELMKLSNKEIDEKVTALSIEDKQSLINEINNKVKESETELIKLETLKSSLKESETELMKSLNELGINSYENLDIEINKLESEINKEIIEYTEAIKEEN